MEKLDSLLELAMLLGQQNDFQEILRVTTKKVVSLCNSDFALIMMINPQTRKTVKMIHSEGDKNSKQKYDFVHTNISGWVIDNNCPFLSQNLKNDKRFRKYLFKDIPIQSVACVPLRTEGFIIGTLLLLSKNKEAPFSENDLYFLEKYASVVAPYLRNAQNLEQYFLAPISKDSLRLKYEAHGLLGKSEKFQELLQAIESAAHCDVRVLLEGNSGTGKELIARAIHNCSERNENKFITIDCGAIPEHLIESELFGHLKGAFTGAAKERKGLFEEANQGTLFMDEITNLPMDLQAKLLRVLQEGEIRPLGSNITRNVDVRVITAASVSLKELVTEKKFREDLYYRLMVYPIHVPSLEERQDDIPLLANHFLKLFTKQQNKVVETFHEKLTDFMKAHSWPGNIRELENFIERMVTLTSKDKKQIDIKMLPNEFRDEQDYVSNKSRMTKPLNESLSDYEEKLIRQALMDHNWNQSRAARALDISEQTIRYKMNKLNISKS